MDQSESRVKPINKGKLRYEDGKIYFSRAAERRFFFALTIIMLVLGAGAKLGIW